MQEGIIMKALSGFYYVRPKDGDDLVACRARGVFKLKGLTPLVGDRVLFERKNDGSGEGTVVELLPRKTSLVRPPMANADTALVVFAVTRPALNRMLLDKFLALSELAGLQSIICLTKADLLQGSGEKTEKLRQSVQELKQVYETIGYPVYITSAADGSGMEELLAALDGRITVIAGQSGAGKSSLINRLIPGLKLETNEISEKLGRGKHTTRHVELFPIGRSGMLADTPGFSQLEFPEMEAEEMTRAFREMAALSSGCKFRGCLHLQEPGCEVLAALEKGAVHPHRYEHYKSFVREVRDRKRRY